MEVLETSKTKYESLTREQLLSLLSERDDRIKSLVHYLFSRKKERFVDQGPSIFDEIEQECLVNPDDPVDVVEEKTIPEHKRRGKRACLPSDLPRKRIELDLDKDKKVCADHGCQLVKIGEDISEKLVIIPATSYVEETATFKYKCPCCLDSITPGRTFFSPERVPDLIPKSFASPSLLAYIAVAKYEDALPLYRQEKIFSRYKIDLKRATMARWMITCAQKCIPLINFMRDDLLESPVVHCDETITQVLKEENRSPESTSYMWVMARSGEKPILLFNYHQRRNKNAAKELLSGYEGFVVCDGYKVYECLTQAEKFIIAGCWAHLRRYFWSAEKAAKQAMPAKAKTPILASQALRYIRDLYLIEREIKGKDPNAIATIRQEKSLPIIANFLAWLKDKVSVVPPKSPTGKAISYALNQWPKMTVYCSDGLIPIDNNYLESHIRPFVIGRSNWVFSDTVSGAEASATLYSLIESAKANGILPYDYLQLIFKELPKASTSEDYMKLLPHHVKDHFQIASYEPPK